MRWKKTARVATLLLASIEFFADPAKAQTTASLTGRLESLNAAAPLAGAAVQAVQQGTRGEPRIWRTATNVAGEFQFTALPTGQYKLCVYDAGEYLDPCQWEPNSVIAIAPGANRTTVRVRRGARVDVRLDDRDGALPKVSESSKHHAVAPFITDANGRRHLLPLVSQSEASLVYSDIVPPDTDLRLAVSSNSVLLADSKGAAIDERGYVVPLRLTVPTLPSVKRGSFWNNRRTGNTVIELRTRGAIPGR